MNSLMGFISMFSKLGVAWGCFEVVPFVGAGNDCLTKLFRGCDGCVASKVADVCFAVVTFAGVGFSQCWRSFFEISSL